MENICTILFHGERLTLMEGKYESNGRIAVAVVGEDGSPYATLSTNIVCADLPDADCFFVKNWSENAELAFAIEQAGIFESVGKSAPAGYATAPIWRIRRYIYVTKTVDGQYHGYKSKEQAEQHSGEDKRTLRVELKT